ncbi:hypothetical protein VIGAN_04001200, partial [Vigna angularis var. angularis]
ELLVSALYFKGLEYYKVDYNAFTWINNLSFKINEFLNLVSENSSRTMVIMFVFLLCSCMCSYPFGNLSKIFILYEIRRLVYSTIIF